MKPSGRGPSTPPVPLLPSRAFRKRSSAASERAASASNRGRRSATERKQSTHAPASSKPDRGRDLPQPGAPHLSRRQALGRHVGRRQLGQHVPARPPRRAARIARMSDTSTSARDRRSECAGRAAPASRRALGRQQDAEARRAPSRAPSSRPVRRAGPPRARSQPAAPRATLRPRPRGSPRMAIIPRSRPRGATRRPASERPRATSQASSRSPSGSWRTGSTIVARYTPPSGCGKSSVSPIRSGPRSTRPIAMPRPSVGDQYYEVTRPSVTRCPFAFSPSRAA